MTLTEYFVHAKGYDDATAAVKARVIDVLPPIDNLTVKVGATRSGKISVTISEQKGGVTRSGPTRLTRMELETLARAAYLDAQPRYHEGPFEHKVTFTVEAPKSVDRVKS